eukprot:CCRYP_015027-RA/>CCRYP_015027-RA protein AED:0.12 eAED:0.12 QI:0/0/0/1/0.2/0.16/6/0/1256
MGIKQDIETSLKDYSITKIDGQPSDEDVTNLVREMTEMLASVPTTNGGGSHGHIGMIIKDAEYRTFSTGNQPFNIPTNPGPYPTTVDPDPATRERQVAEHKAEKEEFETYLGVLNAARQHVIRAMDPEWLEAIRSPTLGFAHMTLREIIDHLRDAGCDLDYMDVSDLIAELTKPWEVSERPATRYTHDDKYERQLIKAGLPDQQALRLSLAQAAFKATGEYDAQLQEFDARPAVDRTFANFRTFIITDTQSVPNERAQLQNRWGLALQIPRQPHLAPQKSRPKKQRGRSQNDAEDGAESNHNHPIQFTKWSARQWRKTATRIAASTADANTGDPTRNAGNLKPTRPQDRQLGNPLPSAEPTTPLPHRTIPTSTLKPILRKHGSKCSRKWTRRRVRWNLRRLKNAAVADAIQANKAFLDSAATSNFSNNETNLELTGPSSKQVAVADGRIIQATHSAPLPMTGLTETARTTTIVPHLAKSLLSVGVLADNGYTTIFHPHAQGAEVYENGACTITATCPPVLQGCRGDNGLWTVPIKDKATGGSQTAARRHNNELASNRSTVPPCSTRVPHQTDLTRAIRNNQLTTFPGLTIEAVNKHFPDSDETQKGHMRESRQGVRSTKVVDEDALLHFKPTPGVKHKDVYLRVYDATKRAMYTDQTDRFPVVSSRVFMVACELDGNYIDAEPIHDRTAKQLTQAYQNIFTRWKATNVIAPNWHIMDNEAPEGLKNAILSNGCPIQTLKGHFISVLAGVADDFPISEWDQLLPQTVLTLNLLRPANVAPNVSAYAYHHGQFDYNRMPLAPMGCAVQFHIKPTRRRSWGEHASNGWYIRTSHKHYRTHVVFVKTTRKTRISDTLYFKHKYLTQPTLTQADAIVQAYRDLIHAIRGTATSNNRVHMEAISKMQEVLEPRHTNVIESPHAPSPRVQRTVPTQQQPPRVREDTSTATPTPTIVVARPQPTLSPPASDSLRKQDEQSIAERVRARRRGTNTPSTPNPESIAERVKQRRMEAAAPVLDHNTGQLLEYRALLRHPKYSDAWNLSAANEFDRLAQGKTERVKGTNTIAFISETDVPHDRFKDVTYIKFVCQVRTEKREQNRTRATLGGNLINYPDDVGTPTADLLLIKIFLNSVISTPGAKFANADISNFYLMTPLKRPEFAKVRLSDIPAEITKLYKLKQLATPDGWVYLRVSKGMYGLPQSGSLGHDLLKQRLNAEGYYQSRITPGLWKQKTRNIQFVLVVDDFGIKYIKRQDLDHLINSVL